MANGFLLRAETKRSCGVEGKAVYNPPTTEVQHYQRESYV